jgi:hypothetical protein
MRLVLVLAVFSCYGQSVTSKQVDKKVSQKKHTVSVKELVEQNKNGKLSEVDKKAKRLANNPYWSEHNFARTVVKMP